MKNVQGKLVGLAGIFAALGTIVAGLATKNYAAEAEALLGLFTSIKGLFGADSATT